MGVKMISVGGEWVPASGIPNVGAPPPPPDDDQYLSLPGVNGAVARVTAGASLHISGSQTMYCLVRAPDWTPAVQRIFASKWIDAGDQRSWVWAIFGPGPQVGGAYFQFTTTGQWPTGGVERTTGTPSPEPAANTWIWLKFEFNATNQQVIYSSAPAGATPDPDLSLVGLAALTWTQIAVTATTTAAGAIFNSTARFTIGGIDSADYAQFQGDFLQLVLVSGSTQLFRLDPNEWVSGTTWTTTTGHTVTLAGTASVLEL